MKNFTTLRPGIGKPSHMWLPLCSKEFVSLWTVYHLLSEVHSSPEDSRCKHVHERVKFVNPLNDAMFDRYLDHRNAVFLTDQNCSVRTLVRTSAYEMIL